MSEMVELGHENRYDFSRNIQYIVSVKPAGGFPAEVLVSVSFS
jgi:hypothetical protein